jgi:hypothetical protein
MVHSLKSDRVSVSFVSEGGFLDDAIFENRFSPLHKAPWIEETPHDGIPLMLQNLRGDFFCAPFGASDEDPNEDRPHGSTANALWDPIETTNSSSLWKLSCPVMGATVTKEIHLKAGHPIVYQEHKFEGGKGRIPIAHHLMLKATSPLKLSFSPYHFAGTPPDPIENNATLGKSIFEYNQSFRSIHDVPLVNGNLIDVTQYPFESGHEDLLMISSENNANLGWSAAVCEAENWVWFSVKNTSLLPSTTLWFSNGGRFYPPFNSRHLNVIGIEECCAYFHLGHKASIGLNPVSKLGIPTSISLGEQTIAIPYAFGVVASPKGFKEVIDVEFSHDEIILIGKKGSVVVAFETEFFKR